MPAALPEHSIDDVGLARAVLAGRRRLEAERRARPRAAPRRAACRARARGRRAARATCAASRPTGPGPTTSTSSPSATTSRVEQRVAARTRAARSATARAPSSQSGMRCRFARRDEQPRRERRRRRASRSSAARGQRFVPARRGRTRTAPQVEKYVSLTTRAPTPAASTPSPTSRDDAATPRGPSSPAARRVLAVLDVQVGAADARADDVEHDVARRGDRLGPLGEADVARPRQRASRGPAHYAAVVTRA